MRSARLYSYRRGDPAFTVVELLVAVSILTLIVLALYGMFSQTQKALRANIHQVDVAEAGRATMHLMGRDLEEMSASRRSGAVNLYTALLPTPPIRQSAPNAQSGAASPDRLNVLQEFFFMRPETNRWYGIGYRVVGATNGIGTLYRFGISTNDHQLVQNELYQAFRLQTNAAFIERSTNWARVTDGVISLRLSAYDPEGRRLSFASTNLSPSYQILRMDSGGRVLPAVSSATPNNATVILRQDAHGETSAYFYSNALPAQVDLELGVLDPEILEQYKALQEGPPQVARDFLSQQADQVQLFRERIPIRTATQ